jgi:hypothetical protein
MRRIPVLVLLAAALSLGGCFALEEIDAGQEIMEQHYRHGGDSEDKEVADEDSEGTGLADRARGWLSRFKTQNSPAERDRGPGVHPDNVLGKCDTGGSLTFTRKFDCQRMNGKFRPLPNSAARK